MSGTPGAIAPRMSLIVRTRNDEATLPRLLDSVTRAGQRFRLGPSSIEVIVVDNGSADASIDIALARGCRVTHVGRRSVAAVRNGGATIARGDVLAFVDADHRLHRDTFTAIDLALATGRFIGGATGSRPERMTLRHLVRRGLRAPLVWATGVDGGVIFCYRSAFEEIGGHDERAHGSEALMLQLRLLQLGCTLRPRRTIARVTAARSVVARRAIRRRAKTSAAVMARLAWWRWKAAAIEGLRFVSGRPAT